MNHALRCSGYDLVKTDIVRAQDCDLTDAHGKRYIDFEAGVWCTALGHNHPRVNQTIRPQLEQISHIGYRVTNPLVEGAAEEVLSTVAISDGRCVFLSSGSEAVEFGVQVAGRLTGKPLLLTLSDSYLAAYGSAGRKSPEEWHCFNWSGCVACPHESECDPQCSRLREIPFERIGALVFEPGNSSGLVKLPPRALVQTLSGEVKQRGGLVVVDEVTTGLGRTGAWYGFQHYGLQPDIIALGKGLGNGYPVSAVAMTHDIADWLEENAFRYAQSHQNDPLGCAVAKEVIAVIREEGLVARSHQVGERFLRELEHLDKRHDIIKEVRGRGLMIAAEFEDNDGRFSLDSVFRGLLERGFLVGYKPAARLLRFYPPLTIAEEHIAKLLEHLDHIFGRPGSTRGECDMTRSVEDLPRVRINFLPTPLVELKRLAGVLNGPRILMKRDDLTGLALGGNKTRKLEFLLGEALSQGCDAVITGGAAQSNHCRQTAGAAAAVGLECHLALGGEKPASPDGNLLLDHLFGAIIHWCGDQTKGEHIPEIAEKLRSNGRNPYIIPYGGSNAVGAMGFVTAISELKEQLSARNERVDFVIIPSSSGGTHAGMTVGLDIYDLPTQIIGIGIDKGESGEPPYESELAGLADQIAKELGLAPRYTESDFQMRYDYFGQGYGVVSELEREAMDLTAMYEGILLDPVYTGRAMGGLIDMIRNKEFTSSDTVLFWHTGGTPALFQYAKELTPV